MFYLFVCKLCSLWVRFTDMKIVFYGRGSIKHQQRLLKLLNTIQRVVMHRNEIEPRAWNLYDHVKVV